MPVELTDSYNIKLDILGISTDQYVMHYSDDKLRKVVKKGRKRDCETDREVHQVISRIF